MSSALSSGDMGVGKSCLLHQFTEKKCKYRALSRTIFSSNTYAQSVQGWRLKNHYSCSSINHSCSSKMRLSIVNREWWTTSPKHIMKVQDYWLREASSRCAARGCGLYHSTQVGHWEHKINRNLFRSWQRTSVSCASVLALLAEAVRFLMGGKKNKSL